MLRLLEPRDEKFRECQFVLRTCSYSGTHPLVALTIDPDRGEIWYTDGTPAGTHLPKISTASWNWYLLDLDYGRCYKGTKMDILKALHRPGIIPNPSDALAPVHQSA